jgi:YHS domain-containing protein
MDEPSIPKKEVFTACGGKITDASSYPGALYHGERVYFCTRACLKAFEAAPDPFMAGEIEHPLSDE